MQGSIRGVEVKKCPQCSLVKILCVCSISIFSKKPCKQMFIVNEIKLFIQRLVHVQLGIVIMHAKL